LYCPLLDNFSSIDIPVIAVATRNAQALILLLSVLGMNVMAICTFLGCMVGSYFEDYLAFMLRLVCGKRLQQMPRLI
jgi:GTP-dependent phosphoenolpyruvate carboxykinase